ncbi:MAG: serine/threonine-protein phosphatase [Planctomycetes bacterium]|nr:serine/threonine-protein phosphatase [Planctomycetota bacterium]
MTKPGLITDVSFPQTFTDVLYLTNQGQMPPEIRRLLKDKKVSYCVVPIDKFPQMLYRLDLIGTAIIDTGGLNTSQQQKLARIIESIETKNIGAILLGSQSEQPVKSFSLSSAKTSFSMATTVKSFSIDELWFSISSNLAYRKKNSDIIVKPAISPSNIPTARSNKLAEQLKVTGALVENLTEQLHLAGIVQHDFLPDTMPNCDKVQWATTFMPAEWVSGDIYDVVQIDEKHIGFYITDAVGHSMPAALLTIFMKQALVMREGVNGGSRIFSPAEVMSNLNNRLAGQKLSGYQFATCCYCLLDIETLQLTYSRAGHPYPILIRPNSQPEQLEIRGPLLGIFKDAEYVQQTIQLQPGDKFLLYSDGAEPFIGGLDDLAGFNLKEEFCKIKDLPIVEMFDKFNVLVKEMEIEPGEIDDVTAVGLEIR